MSGCATAYKANGWGGGYSETRLAEDIYQVTFRGNKHTSKNEVNNGALRRAAELTLANRYKFFEILSFNEDSKVGTFTTPTTVNSQSSSDYSGFGNYSTNIYSWHGFGNTSSYSTIAPGNTFFYRKHTDTITIKMLRDRSKNPNAFDARIILSNFK